MKSLEARFKKVQHKNQYWSSLCCFNSAITRQGYAGKILKKWFNLLVDKDEYCNTDKKAILAHAEHLTKHLVEGIK